MTGVGGPQVMISVVDGLSFGEGPRWRDGALWFSDIGLGNVMRWTPEMGRTAEVLHHVRRGPSGLGFLPNGDLLVASMFDQRVLAFDRTGAGRVHADLSGLVSSPLSDMVVVPSGDAFVGSIGAITPRGNEFAFSTLIRVTIEGAASVVADQLEFPNGMVVIPSPTGGTLVVAESTADRLTAFDICRDGSLANRRVWAELDDVAPDGICLDANGSIWVANGAGSNCLLVAEHSRVLADIDVGRTAFAVALRDDEPTLYVVVGDPSAADIPGRADGEILSIEVEVCGAGSP